MAPRSRPTVPFWPLTFRPTPPTVPFWPPQALRPGQLCPFGRIRRPARLDPARFARQDCRFHPVADAQLAEDLLDVGFHRVLAQVHLGRDLSVGVAAADQAEDRDL